ncbi:MAG: tetratricopeptide (TPR) repeat protein [Saprospiraceae bacterium]|jgi:tetratricopeptide (TPR) repeat protein
MAQFWLFININLFIKSNTLKYIFKLSFLLILSVAIFSGCASKRKKKGGEPSKLSKFYHNTTALYNGYFNANELMKESYMTLKQSHKDNYTELLPLYDYVTIADPKVVYANLDKAIEKVTTVASLHAPSKWVDDCYVLMGEAQYLKQEFETAEETFAYFKDEFNPNNPFGRNYKKKKKNKKQIKKEKEKERKQEKEARADKKEEEKDAREEEKKAKKEAKEEADKARKKEREDKKKAREEAKKKKKKSKKRGGKKKRPKKEEEVVKKEEVIDEKITKDSPKVVDKKEKTKLKKEDIGVEKVQTEKKEVEKKKDKTAYSKGMMWYAKTLVQRDKLSNASYMVKRMKEDGEMPDEARREVPVILADINIREENYSTAISYLDEAIELANDKALKARYAFVQGQLYMKSKDYSNAAQSFDNAKKWAKSFEMEFMAELNAEKTNMMGGSKSDGAVIAKLDKMVKEEKYFDYLDQLYYTKGEILLEKGDFDAALKSFSKSIANNTNNIALKQETYYKLAYLFYDKEKYVNSKFYFDSTLQVLEKEDPRYRDVKNYSENLSEIAQNIQMIKIQDSLLNMVAWSDKKIVEVAEKLVEENLLAREGSGKTETPSGRKSTALMNGLGGGLKSSNFFAYSPVAKQRGQIDFKSRWGDIELSDNWRRSDKSGIFGTDEEEVPEEKVAEDGFQEDEITQMINNIKSKIPYSAEAKLVINSKLEKAFYELGKAYRDKIQKYEKAAVTHEELLSRFPNFDNKLDVYYYLYLSYLDLNNSTKANYYKEKILSEFPDTEFAKAISNPNYAAGKLTEEQKLNKYYEETYELFEKGDYQSTFTKAEQSEQIFGKQNNLKPKFALVKAMSIGSIEGKGPYITALKDVITRFPNTPEKARADEILRFLQGDKDAFTGIDIEEVDDIFSVEDQKLHYVAVVLYGVTPAKVVETKIQVSNYNKQYHKLKKLQLGESPLDPKKDTEIVLIRRFENKEKAMEYYNEVMKSKEEFISGEIAGYTIYPITQRNYRKMIIERTDARYRVWFEKNYLNK